MILRVPNIVSHTVNHLKGGSQFKEIEESFLQKLFMDGIPALNIMRKIEWVATLAISKHMS
ncbi:MAG: hypothetical protein DI626_08985 [Micavibrio aeruginosavorus]|uniref:Uncharacterized protein n=1 Tax=Micavibrio aeruginosavorus TaxID=349221 RepID=A0A2W4ZS31_9BACT|nr:MAG: hypothetical protein DI626_08985 [Micavibrio aeruginosavorus]